MAVWIRLQQLPIEYYQPEFLKHVGQKLGKLLKIDAITNAAIRGRYARVCVQINMTDPLPKRVRIGSFWQDIVYENLPVLCYQCRRIGHRETHCLESMKQPTTNLQASASQCPAGPPHDTTHVSTPWKTVQTRQSHTRGRPLEMPQRSRNTAQETIPLKQPREQAVAENTQWKRTTLADAVLGHHHTPANRTPVA